jgi:membrane-associated phospholipid phosphatase
VIPGILVLTALLAVSPNGPAADTIPEAAVQRSVEIALAREVVPDWRLVHTTVRVSAAQRSVESSPTAGFGPVPRVDLWVAERVRSPRIQGSALIDRSASVLRHAAIPGTVALAAALYGAGRLGDRPDLTDLGMHTGQAVVGAGIVTVGGKLVLGRARPGTAPSDPADFGFGRGFSSREYQSFPSTHTAAAFAAATVISMDVGDRRGGASIWAQPAIFGAAASMGASRIYHEEHWASDVIVGAILGSVIGWRTVEFHRSRASAP